MKNLDDLELEDMLIDATVCLLGKVYSLPEPDRTTPWLDIVKYREQQDTDEVRFGYKA